jgi:hypothetical protein
MDRTGSTLGDPTPELGASQADDVAEHPKERHVAGHIDLLRRAVDVEGEFVSRHRAPSAAMIQSWPLFRGLNQWLGYGVPIAFWASTDQ